MTNSASERPCLVFCKCAHYEIIPQVSREQILAALSQTHPQMDVVEDLCGLAAHHDPRLQAWAQTPGLAIVACFPRAVRWLFHAAGVPLSSDRVRFFNMRTQSPDDIIRELPVEAEAAHFSNQPSTINHQPSSWVPWFPVIDYDRCKNCKQCLNFCLFGVYQLSQEGKVQVRNPAGCKTNCPACARMCPQKAIIFPKYADAPINGDVGAGPDAGQPQGGAPAGDLYDKIRQHGTGRKRFSRDSKEDAPGRSCPTLEGLRRELGVSDDVLASLSPAELQRVMARKNAEPMPPDSGSGDGGKDKHRNG
jgi:NAD-dependent dihydropyrimidine dehydrogenase PreA subunit